MCPQQMDEAERRSPLSSITAGQRRLYGGIPNGIRTRAAALKGRCPRPLDDGDQTSKHYSPYPFPRAGRARAQPGSAPVPSA